MAPTYDEEATTLKESSEPSVFALGGATPKEWRGGLLNCFAGCDLIAWGAVGLTQCAPCVAFG